MSLKNFLDEDVYLDKSYLPDEPYLPDESYLPDKSYLSDESYLPDENPDLISNEELLSSSDEKKSLLGEKLHSLLDKPSLPNELPVENELFVDSMPFLNEESPNIFTQNAKRKIGDNDKKTQCQNTFELTTSTTNLAAHLRADHRLDKNGPLLPLSSIQGTTQSQPTQSDPSQHTLPKLFSPIKRLQNNLAKDKERTIKNNAKTLENLLLHEEDLLGIQELVGLLGPFAHVTTIIGRDHYPTYSMMLPLIKILQEHLFQKETTLMHPIVCNVCDKIELSFRKRWDEPNVEGYIAAVFDPRFKNLSFEPEKLKSIKNELKHKMEDARSALSINLTTPSIENNPYSYLLNSLFEETSQQ
ncbi:12917_t:CDS:2, partial [Gigaspora rosea]